MNTKSIFERLNCYPDRDLIIVISVANYETLEKLTRTKLASEELDNINQSILCTNEKVGLMEPGRELDALIAEKVMGWVHHADCSADDHEACWEWTRPDGLDMGRGKDIPNYSTDIAAAWSLVNHLIKDLENRNFKVSFHLNYSGEFYWYAGFWIEAVSYLSHEDPNDGALTPSNAICLAALRAVRK